MVRDLNVVIEQSITFEDTLVCVHTLVEEAAENRNGRFSSTSLRWTHFIYSNVLH